MSLIFFIILGIKFSNFTFKLVAFFARSSKQSLAEEPSLYLTRHWKVEDGKLVLVEDN